MWTWPNEESVADPNKNDRKINSDTTAINILNGDAVTYNRLAIDGEPNGVTTPVLTLDNASSLTVNGRLSIGGSDNTRGQIDILGGSTLIILKDDGDDLNVADEDGTWGTVNIVGSTVDIADNLDIDQGTGYLNISDNATVIIGDDMEICKGEGSAAEIYISGPNTLVTCGDDIKLGRRGTTILEITGGTVYCTDLELEAPDGHSGLLNLHGGTIIVNKSKVNKINDGDNRLDIAGDGKLVLTGTDDKANLEEFINAGKVTAGGIVEPRFISIEVVDDNLEVTANLDADLEIAWHPGPAVGDVNEATSMPLEWTPGDGAVSHDVYFSDNFADVNEGTTPLLNLNPTEAVFLIGYGLPGDPYPGGLVAGTTYYWRVDELDQFGSTHKGDVLSFSTPPAVAITDPNLLIWWQRDEVLPVALDQSGHNHTGVIKGAEWAADGQSLVFGGDGDHVICEDGDFLNGLSEMTYCVWVKSNITDTDNGCIRFGNQDARQIRYDKDGSKNDLPNVIKYGVCTTEGDDTREEDESSGSVQTTEWQHLAVTWQSGVGCSLYINGVLDIIPPAGDKPAQGGVTDGYEYVALGKGGKNGLDEKEGWDGKLDDLRVYDVALSAAEINDIITQAPCPVQ